MSLSPFDDKLKGVAVKRRWPTRGLCWFGGVVIAEDQPK